MHLYLEERMGLHSNNNRRPVESLFLGPSKSIWRRSHDANADGSDICLQGAGGGGDEPGYTRRKIREFLCIHTAYELIPESGKVIMLDADLPMRQGFHALHEQVSCLLTCSFAGVLCVFFEIQ